MGKIYLNGEIKLCHFYDSTSLLMDFAKFVAPNQAVSDISTVDLKNYRKKLIKVSKSPNPINKSIAAVKAMYIYSWYEAVQLVSEATMTLSSRTIR